MGSRRLFFASKALQLVLFLARTYSTRVPATSAPHDAKKLLQDRRRGAERTKQYSKVGRSIGPSAGPRSVNQSNTRRQRRDKKAILRTVKSIDKRLSNYDWSLPCLSTDDRTLLRFLRSHLASFTRDGLQQTILFIKVALEELRVAAGSLDDGLMYLDGYGFEHEVDEKFIANLQYLLNTICSSLSQTLARQLKATTKEEANQGHDVRNYRGMAAFPDNCRPISTTWPWTIKPSLAVLWGVCWMFYGDGDSSRVPQERIVNDPDAAQWIGWRRNSDAYLQYGREQIQGLEDALSAPESQRHVDPLLPSQPELDGSGAVGQVRDGGLGIHNIQNIRNIHPLAAPHTSQPLQQFSSYCGGLFQALDSSSDAVLNSWHPHRDAYAITGQNQGIWPQADKFCNTATGGHEDTVDLESAFSQPWQLASERYHIPVNVAPQPAFRGSPSHLTRHSHISVQVQAPDGEQTAPLYDPSPVRSNISNATTPQQPYVDDFGSWQTQFPFNMGDVETQRASDVVHQQPYTPVSMADESHTDTSPRGRLEAPRRTPEPLASDSDESEEDQTSPGGHDDSLPSIIRRGHTFKRPGEPPKNRENKMICRFPECSSLIFERKCEWSKHMDKHERPYKCLLAGCEKLQGFTYSGGLLRHEREVHKMHGGTKASLYCPFQHCKRSSGNGFTRKENLNEHVRRVHRKASGSSNPGSPLNKTEEEDDRAAAEADDEVRDPMQISTKRKRSITNESEGGETDKDDLREEIKRLRRETAEKDERLRRLEEAVRDLSRQRT